MTPEQIIAELDRLGVKVRLEGDRIVARPIDKVPPAIKAAVKACRTELRRLLAGAEREEPQSSESAAAEEALTIINRLRAYTLPEGRVAAAQAMIERLRPLLETPELDAIDALTSLQVVEAHLVALGGRYDPELADTIGLINRAFPGCNLVNH